MTCPPPALPLAPLHPHDFRIMKGRLRTMRWKAALFLMGTLALAGCGSSLEGSGDVVTETRTVADFIAVDADNGVRVLLTVDPTAAGDVALAVITDSNLQEFLTTEVSGTRLSVSTDRNGGVTPTGAFDVSATVAVIGDVSVDDETLEASTVIVEADNGAQISVCATGAVTGEVKNGAILAVFCGGNVDGVKTSDGGAISSP